MAETSITKLYSHAKRAEDSLRRMRAREKENTSALMNRVGGGVATVAGLVLAGAVDGKWGHDNKSFGVDREEKNGIAHLGPVPINSGAGLVLLAVSVPGFLPGSEYICQLGAAMFGYPLAKSIEAKLSESASK